ncbi:MAG: PASTA domain-containing protein [Ignavibacteria bacterium]|nr:PASTA domain-containing protein [Ignavibacteria bacterium]
MKSLIQRGIIKRAAIIAGIFFAFLMLLNYLIMPWYVNSAVIVVPKVQGMNIEEARAKLEDIGLNVIVGGTIPDASVHKGVVIRQRPFENEQVKKGRTVYLFVSGGKATVTMPSLVGQTINQAKLQLNKNDLKLGEVTYIPSSIAEGQIVSQEILAGSAIAVGSKVDVQISAGLEHGNIDIPGLTGMSLSEAEKVLREANLAIGKIEYKGVEGILPGTVIEQNPAQGKKLNAGEKVDIIIAKDVLPSKDE